MSGTGIVSVSSLDKTVLGMGETERRMRGITWEDGTAVPLAYGPARHRIVVHCTVAGRQRARFADGREYPYASYIEIVSSDGQRVRQGTVVVPVLADGRLLMVIEQRPAQGPSGVGSFVARGKTIDLGRSGPFSSLEFPGGAVDPGEDVVHGMVRELKEETGVQAQEARLYLRRPLCQYGADIASRQTVGVAYLTWNTFTSCVGVDGGLAVLALTADEVQYNIRTGAIVSGPGALNAWHFYREVEEARENPALYEQLSESGYLSLHEVRIS